MDIVYAFYDDDPEYFLVEVERKEEFEVYYDGVFQSLPKWTKYMHIIGYIENDQYRYGLNYQYGGAPRVGEIYYAGKSAYTLCGYRDEKKYYGASVHGIWTEEGILQIYKRVVWTRAMIESRAPGTEENYEQKIIPESKYKELMKKNYKFGNGEEY